MGTFSVCWETTYKPAQSGLVTSNNLSKIHFKQVIYALSLIGIKPIETQCKISPEYLHIVLYDQTPN